MNIKKIVSMVLSCAVLAVSVLSIGASATKGDYITFGPYYTAKHYGSGTMFYKYTTAIDIGPTIKMTVDGSNYISRIAVGSTDAKTINTYACIYSGLATTSRLNGNLFNYPTANSTINKGKIVVGVSAVYYPSGSDAMDRKTETVTSTNSASVSSSMTTSEKLTSYGGIEYRNNVDVMYAYLTTKDY